MYTLLVGNGGEWRGGVAREVTDVAAEYEWGDDDGVMPQRGDQW